LSQWYPAGFEDEANNFYATAEHYMMAQKAILFEDLAALKAVFASESPQVAKKVGRSVQNFKAEVWEQHSYEFVKKGNYLKFSQHQNLRIFLIETAPCVIVEASPYDKIWGIGLKQQDPLALHPSTWQGTNLLGFALMEVRDALESLK
jgi:ribA/ribD-fused uncharacterized protein